MPCDQVCSVVRALTSTSPSALMCVAAWKYVRTARKLGVLAGIKSKKSLEHISNGISRGWRAHANNGIPRTVGG